MQGNIFPFLKNAKDIVPFILNLNDKKYVPIDSIAISGHKFIGTPFPCGVSVYRKEALEDTKTEIIAKIKNLVQDNAKVYKDIEIDEDYFKEHGTITSGAKNDYMAVVIWKRVKELGYDGFKEFARNTIAVSEYAEKRLKETQDKTGIISHIDIMPQVSTEKIDEFINDLIIYKQKN